MGNSSAKNVCDNEWTRKYNEIKRNHDEAYRRIDSAITLEEEDRKHEALEQYKNGIAIIDRVLTIHVECPEHTDQTWEAACRMIQKMKRTRAETIKRISMLQSQLADEVIAAAATAVPSTSHDQPPPTYDEAMSETSSTSSPQTYSELASALENLQIEPTKEKQNVSLLYSQSNIRIYLISPDGTVVSFSDLLTLNLYLITSERKENEPSAYLEINDWIYPLIPGVSPCFRSEFGALIVPDTNAPVPGSAIGIVLPPEADINILLNLLDDIIYGVVSAEQKEGAVPKVGRHRRAVPYAYSSTISNGIANTAWYMREGLIKGAQAAGSLISYGTPKIINRLRPAEDPTRIDPRVSQGLQTAKNITGTAVSVTGFVAEKVGSATMSLGRYLAPHIQKQGTKLLASGLKMDEEVAHQHMDDVLTVAAGAVEGIATVYSGLEQSSKILGDSLTQNTVKIVEHKYGPEVGGATGDSIYAMGNLYNFSHSLNLFKPSKMAKVAAKNTGKGVLRDFRENHVHHGGYILPDLSSFHQHLQNSASSSNLNNNKN